MKLILVLLALLLLASTASAQDMPDLVLIDVDLSWSIPAYPSGGVHVAGRSIWENGVGYITPSYWPVTGISCAPGACLWMVEYMGGIPLLDGGGNAVTGSYDIHSVLFTDPVIDVFRHPAEGGHINVSLVPTPELAILRSFTKHIGGQQFNALVNPTLQRITAWGAAKLLGAPHSDDRIFLPSATLEVQEWCSGIVSMKWLLLLGVMLAIVGSRRFSMAGKIVLIIAAPLIAMECNIARVAATGAGIEWFGVASRGAIKEWLGWGAMVFGVVQVVGIGWAAARTGRRTMRRTA